MALNLEGVRGWVDVEFAPVDLRSELQVVAELQTRQDIIITARMRGAITDFEEIQRHRQLLGEIGMPEDWEALVEERKAREERGGQAEDYPRHGSPPANQ
jgi:predicted TIM-barrel fold metal-dependent hydrolase